MSVSWNAALYAQYALEIVPFSSYSELFLVGRMHRFVRGEPVRIPSKAGVIKLESLI